MERIPADYLPPRESWPALTLPPEHERIGELNLTEELLDKNVREGRGNHVAIFFEDRRVTYRELHLTVNRIANGLREIGVKTLDRVGLRFANIP